MSDILAILPAEWRGDGRPCDLVLPHTLWSRLFIGTRLVLETDTGEVCAAFVEVGPADAPILRWPLEDERDPRARRVTVRMPR